MLQKIQYRKGDPSRAQRRRTLPQTWTADTTLKITTKIEQTRSNDKENNNGCLPQALSF
jgi:hypothetical protein